MTHNITSNEAHKPSAHVRIHVARRRRHPAGVRTFLASWFAVGGIASLIDTVIGQPVCLMIAIVALGVWRFWPTGR